MQKMTFSFSREGFYETEEEKLEETKEQETISPVNPTRERSLSGFGRFTSGQQRVSFDSPKSEKRMNLGEKMNDIDQMDVDNTSNKSNRL